MVYAATWHSVNLFYYVRPHGVCGFVERRSRARPGRRHGRDLVGGHEEGRDPSAVPSRGESVPVVGDEADRVSLEHVAREEDDEDRRPTGEVLRWRQGVDGGESVAVIGT